MSRLIYLFLALAVTSYSFAQEGAIGDTPLDSLLVHTSDISEEEMPRFPGCEEIEDPVEQKKCSDDKLVQFIYSNLKYPPLARENGVEGIAVARFIIRKTGEVTDIEIARDIGGKTGPEIIRVLELMPDWIPGMQRGEPVNVMFHLPVKFALVGKKKGKKKKKAAG